MPPTPKPDDATTAFHHAAALAARGLVTDALAEFQSVADRWPKHAVADDALYDVGACHLALNRFQAAADTFHQVIERYPTATIEPSDPPGEVGLTAARAWLGLVHAHLGLGDVAAARKAAAELEQHGESRIHAAPGVERTYHDVAVSLLAATLDSHAGVDEVGPDDTVAEAAGE